MTMLTKLTIRNFKQFEDVTVELDNVAVFVGPNDSGKTTALQALALWELGLRRWRERWGRDRIDRLLNRGVSINRLDLFSVPLARANMLWRGLRTRSVSVDSRRGPMNLVRIEIIVDGVTPGGEEWTCGLEFIHTNSESLLCRPVRTDPEGNTRMVIPEGAHEEQVAFLPPMSGLSSTEPLLQPGTVNVLLGEGRTAEVLRNLCYDVFSRNRHLWNEILVPNIAKIFGATVLDPQYNAERGEINVRYEDAYIPGLRLDLASSGRGFQQTLLLTAYLLLHPYSVILLDEPDAHLEILRQRQIYQAITETAEQQKSQLLIATHSEVVMNEAAGRHMVTAFVGPPHRIDSRVDQVQKSLSSIGYEQYIQAEQKKWVLYLEGSTDLAILQAFARHLQHPAAAALESPFVHYVGNQPKQAEEHFWALREACKPLRGFALFDRLDLPSSITDNISLLAHTWTKCEIENYFCSSDVLKRWAESEYEEQGVAGIMDQSIVEIEDALQRVNLGSPWDGELKVSDQFFQPVFKSFYDKLGKYNTMSKANYHVLVNHAQLNEIDPEVISVLDTIATVADDQTSLD